MSGPRPKSKVKIVWSPNFAYAIGLMTTDGNLSPDERHLDFTSKDKEQILNFMKSLDIKVKIGFKKSGETGKRVLRVQFGDVNFYKFLLRIGLMPNKSKVLSGLTVPNQYFFDFLRGHFDGDGSFYSYWDPRWKQSFMFYTTFISASYAHIVWIREKIFYFLKIRGHVSRDGKKTTYQLKYAKKDSMILLRRLYYAKTNIYLSRKYLKIKRALAIIGLSL